MTPGSTKRYTAVFGVAVRQADASPPDARNLTRAVQAILTVTDPDGIAHSVDAQQIAVTVTTNASATLASFAASLLRRLSETNATASTDWAVTVQVANATPNATPTATATPTLPLPLPLLLPLPLPVTLTPTRNPNPYPYP
jgi:UDP-N-acetylmuramyl tripeptide synthase